MIKNYFYIITVIICLFSFSASAQENKQTVKAQETSIEGLSFYPNPVSSGKIYITSKFSGDREIVIFDVLGKKVFQTTSNAKELNISNISPGVYIIRFKENEASATRKLIIK